MSLTVGKQTERKQAQKRILIVEPMRFGYSRKELDSEYIILYSLPSKHFEDLNVNLYY